MMFGIAPSTEVFYFDIDKKNQNSYKDFPFFDRAAVTYPNKERGCACACLPDLILCKLPEYVFCFGPHLRGDLREVEPLEPLEQTIPSSPPHLQGNVLPRLTNTK